jgi:hypothetical protein
MIRVTVFFVFFLLVGAWCTSAQADSRHQISAKGQLRSVGPSYYTAVDAEFLVSYANPDLPWGTKVFLRHGFERSEFHQGALRPVSDWNDVSVSEMTASGPYRWEARLVKQVYTRGSSWHFTGLDFVFEIVLPDGHVMFDKGSDSTWGYYEASAPDVNGTCDSLGDNFCDLSVQAIERY